MTVLWQLLTLIVILILPAAAEPWPYNRVHQHHLGGFRFNSNKSVPEFHEPKPPDHFVQWLREAEELLSNLNYPLDPRCTINRSSWWYRTADGSCNWLKQDEYEEGKHTYADGISKPRDGPNPRARLYYNHTSLLLGMIEFIMHDVTYSEDSTAEYIDVPMPPDETTFPLNTTFRVWRSLPYVNMATTWLDISSLYGSTSDVASALRSYKDGKLLTQEVQARGTKKKASYLPFNTMRVPTRTRPGMPVESLFAGGDPRTNEDWVMLGVHTLMLREHNRLCDILKNQKPTWNDKRLYNTVRLIMSAKYMLMANSYQMTYWTDEMPWPRDDGYPLYRQIYPWPLVTKNGRPMKTSAEMAIVYRFHEFIISSFPIIDPANKTLWEQDLFDTGFNATGFIDAGLENVLRGMVTADIPNFKSGVDENFRSANHYRNVSFDVATWSIVHEREQGLPTFNQYFRAYNLQDPSVPVPIRDTFEKFSSVEETVKNLKKLYKHPDEVDLVVGVQLDEEYFPGTTVPKSALIISLFSLFGMGNSDRFSIGFAMMRCFNALEDLLWERKEIEGFPDFRFYSNFWLTELDIQAHGANLLWRLITENSEIPCVQKMPLFPPDPVKNPILCSLEETPVNVGELLLTFLQVILALLAKHKWQVNSTVIAGLGAWIIGYTRKTVNAPPVLRGWPVVGEALSFQKDPLALLQEGFSKYGASPSRCFGIKLASLTHYVITNRADLKLIKEDNPYEIKFNLHQFFVAINCSIITKKENFESDIHTKLIRTHLSDPETVSKFGPVIHQASNEFINRNPLAADKSQNHPNGINDWIDQYITFVVSRCIIGPKGYDNSDLLKAFLKFNDDAIKAMGLASLLPSFLQFLAASDINKDFDTIHKATLPIIKERRSNLATKDAKSEPVFLDFFLEVVDDDNRAADLIAIVVWVGLVNLQATVSSTLLDIINDLTGQETISSSLSSATLANLDTFSHGPSEWSTLRSAMFESLRLCRPIIGPARIVALDNVHLASQPELSIPKGEVATLSGYFIHRDKEVWGPEAEIYKPRRFKEKLPEIGEPEFVTWGLKGPHMCPGRWFAQETIQIMVKVVLDRYEFDPERRLKDSEKYVYSAGNAKGVNGNVNGKQNGVNGGGVQV
ncbi:heme peroxidase [Podospora fimiseda]|uniref:Heme peroxidase n=1 Tax=Podospora fimiseda TaxID=252190 RepID=A0AAN7BDB0_9PEZI|nr:heme peroxidase [Podospora fimiseda]